MSYTGIGNLISVVRMAAMDIKKVRIMAAVGIFVVVGALCLVYLTVKLGRLQLFSGSYYEVYGEFDSVAGLNEDASVEIAGVDVGRVDRITLDPKTGEAIVAMRIQQGIRLTDDVIASVRTQGLIGDTYNRLSRADQTVFSRTTPGLSTQSRRST